MSSAPAMTSGMLGKAESSLLNSMPGTGQGSVRNPNAPPSYNSEPIQPKLMPMNIDVSSRRNVLPCKGINHLVLRPEPPPASQGMVPPRGNGRHNGPGLSQERPVNLPILPFSDPFASGFNNPLKSAA